MTKTTRQTISLPMATETREYRTGSLTDAQIQTLTDLAQTEGIIFHTHADPTLKNGKPSRWTCLATIAGKMTPVVIEADGTRTR